MRATLGTRPNRTGLTIVASIDSIGEPGPIAPAVRTALLLSGTIWFPAWSGVGFVAGPALVAGLVGYAFWVRAAVLQTMQPFEVRGHSRRT